MKKIFYTILAAAAMFAGCNREIIIHDGTGSLSLDLSCKTDYKDVPTKASLTDEEIINGLVIDITRPYDGKVLNYPAFSEIKGKVVELGSGSYVLRASSPVKKDAAFDQPIFDGSKEFDIRTGEVTSVNLTCTISNAMVSVILTDNFVRELSDYTVTVSNGKGNLSWTKTGGDINDFEPAAEGSSTVYKGKRSGYFTLAPLTVTVDGHRSIDGTSAATTYSINTVNAADHHIIRLDAEVIGSAGINITISNEVKPIDQIVVVPGFEEKPVEGDKPSEGEGGGEDSGNGDTEPEIPVGPSTAPTLVWESNPDFEDVQLPLNAESADVELVLNAPEGIREFLIYVKSGVLTETIAALTEAGTDGIVDGVATMDMINDDVLYENLGTQLPMKDQVLNQPKVELSLSTLVPYINLYGDSIQPGDEHIFTLYVVDNKNQVLEQQVTIVSVAAE